MRDDICHWIRQSEAHRGLRCDNEAEYVVTYWLHHDSKPATKLACNHHIDRWVAYAMRRAFAERVNVRRLIDVLAYQAERRAAQEGEKVAA